jgi:ssDNA-binding Zn-finger/Zn-ribbon topoisomerase 1
VGVLLLNSCPKCKGDVILGNKDQYGWYEQCLQCGYLRDLEVIVQVGRQPATEKRMTKSRRSKRIAGRQRA